MPLQEQFQLGDLTFSVENNTGGALTDEQINVLTKTKENLVGLSEVFSGDGLHIPENLAFEYVYDTNGSSSKIRFEDFDVNGNPDTVTITINVFKVATNRNPDGSPREIIQDEGNELGNLMLRIQEGAVDYGIGANPGHPNSEWWSNHFENEHINEPFGYDERIFPEGAERGSPEAHTGGLTGGHDPSNIEDILPTEAERQKAIAASQAERLNEQGEIAEVDDSNGPSLPTGTDTFEEMGFFDWFQVAYDALDGSFPAPPFVNAILALMIAAQNNASPIVLDLDGDGIELTPLGSGNTTFFDLDGDGFAERTGFVNADDAILVYDQNNDGRIEGTSEWFGTMDTDGFTVLAQYDLNEDLVIDESDAIWLDLLLWRDINQNGISDAGELFTLGNCSIVSIDIDATSVTQTNQGHSVTHTSTYTMDDGVNPAVVRAAHDVWFNYDDVSTRYAQEYVFDLRAAYLPGQRGYGHLPDFHISVSLDNDDQDPDSLISLVTDFSALDIEDVFADDGSAFEAVRDIMYRWAGVDSLSGDERGPNIDSRELGFLEAMTGQPFLQRGYYSDPYYYAGQDLERGFYIAQQNIYARLAAQSAGGDLLAGDWYYDIASDAVVGVTGLDSGVLDDLETLAGTQGDKAEFWKGVVRMIEFTVGVNNLPGADETALDDAIFASDNALSLSQIQAELSWVVPVGTTYYGTTAGDLITGSADDDTVWADEGNDTVNGGLGADTIHGEDGDDVMNGQGGDDLIYGGLGNDVYEYEAGHGTDVYEEQGTGTGNDADVIKFGPGIDLNDLTITRVSNTDLRIAIDTGTVTGEILIQDQLNYGGTGGHIESLEFDDTSTFSLEGLAWTLTGTDGNDLLKGVTAGGLDTDTIYGLGGNDTIYGYDGNDTISGGQGNDTVYGGAGGDVINGDEGNDFLRGDDGADELRGGADDDTIYSGDGDDLVIYDSGNDVVQEYDNGSYGGTDIIEMPDGITENDLSFSRSENHLVITVASLGSVTLQHHFYSASEAFETIRFADTSTLDLSVVDLVVTGTEAGETLFGEDGDDTIDGLGGNDTIHAYDGDDIIDGGQGDDTIYGGAGADTIDGGQGNDTVYGGAGVDIIHGDEGNDFLRGSDGADELRGGADDDTIYSGDGDDLLIYDSGNDVVQEYDNGSYGGIDIIEMPDGIAEEDLSFSKVDDNLIITVDGLGTITVTSQFYGSGDRAYETIRFADTSTLDLSTIEVVITGTENGETLAGLDGRNDAIYALGGNDTLYGYGGDDLLYGDDGDDTLYGAAGDDFLFGGEGNDTLRGHAGADEFRGGAGNDTIHSGDGDDLVIYDSGNDIVQEFDNGSYGGTDIIEMPDGITEEDLTFARHSPATNDLVITVAGLGTLTIDSQYYGANYAFETIRFADQSTLDLSSIVAPIYGTEGNESLSGDNNVDDIIYGFGGNDTLSGYSGNDQLYGGDGDDTFYGGTGDDIYHMGGGDDYINEASGGGGHDLFYYEGGLDAIYDTKGGVDTLHILGGATINDIDVSVTGSHQYVVVDSGVDEIEIRYYDYNSNYGVEILRFDDGFQTAQLRDYDSWLGIGSGNDLVAGNGNDETLIGYAGNDTLQGNGGNDATHGGSGDDTLEGGDGDDLLHGGVDDDVLAGGDGQDILYGGAGADTFLFEAASAFNDVDTVEDFSTVEGDKLNIADLLTGYDEMTDLITDFVEITTNGSDSILKVDADGGADNFVQIATLLGVTGLTDEEALESGGYLIA